MRGLQDSRNRKKNFVERLSPKKEMIGGMVTQKAKEKEI